MESMYDFMQFFSLFFIITFGLLGAFITLFGHAYPKTTISTFGFLSALILILVSSFFES